MPLVTNTTDATFTTDVIENQKTVLVEFWAEWCPPCRIMAPILDELARDHDNLSVVKINADENMATATEYRALSLPTMKIFRDGEVVKTIVGARPRAAIEFELGAILGRESMPLRSGSAGEPPAISGGRNSQIPQVPGSA